MSTIVVGYDDTAGSQKALERAATLAKALGAKLVVTSVTPVMMSAGRSGGPIDPTDSIEKHTKELETARTYLEGQGIEADYQGAVGEPADAIVQLAEERGADMIVVGHEHGVVPAGLHGRQVRGGAPVKLDELVHLVERLGAQGLALVERERPREAVAARLDQVADRVHLGRALERGQPRPAVSRPSRGVDRALGVAAVALRDGGDQLTGRRARCVESLAAGARLPASTHEHLLHGLRRHFHPLGRGHGLVDTRRQLIYNRPIRPGSMDSRVRARFSSRAFVVCSMAAQHCARRGG